MSLLGGLTKLAVRTVLLPVSVPVAVFRDFAETAAGTGGPGDGEHTAKTFKGIGHAVEEIAESEDE